MTIPRWQCQGHLENTLKELLLSLVIFETFDQSEDKDKGKGIWRTPSKNDLGDSWALRHLIRVIGWHNMTKKMKKPNTENRERAILETWNHLRHCLHFWQLRTKISAFIVTHQLRVVKPHISIADKGGGGQKMFQQNELKSSKNVTSRWIEWKFQ